MTQIENKPQKLSDFDDLPMRVAIGTYRPITDNFLSLAKQLGVDDVLVTPHRQEGFESSMPLGEVWSFEKIRDMRNRISYHDLRFFAFEKMPIPLYEILLEEDKSAKEEKIRIIKETIRNIGKANVPVLGYSGHPPVPGAVRTTRSYKIRGGAEVSAFDIDKFNEKQLVSQPVEEEKLWEAYELFLNEIIPVAEEVGVTVCAHPSDPPIEQVGGIPLLFRSFENFKRAMSIKESDNHGLKLCLGCWSEAGEDLKEVIQYFGKKIKYVHFRDVIDTAPKFHETFLDDPESNYDEYEIMKTLKQVGFSGVLTPNHVPKMVGDTSWEFGGKRGRIYTVGYLKGMLNALNRIEQRPYENI